MAWHVTETKKNGAECRCFLRLLFTATEIRRSKVVFNAEHPEIGFQSFKDVKAKGEISSFQVGTALGVRFVGCQVPKPSLSFPARV